MELDKQIPTAQNLVMGNDHGPSRSLLQAVPIFSNLSEQEFAFLTTHVVQRRFQAGDLIFAEGDICAGLYVVQSGNVRIFKSSASGREQVLTIDGPGSSIAELPVFDGGGYPASARAVNDCKSCGGRRRPAPAVGWHY